MLTMKIAVVLAVFGLCACAPPRPDNTCKTCASTASHWFAVVASWRDTDTSELEAMLKKGALGKCSAGAPETCKTNIEKKWPQMFADMMGKRVTEEQLCAKYYGCKLFAEKMVLAAAPRPEQGCKRCLTTVATWMDSAALSHVAEISRWLKGNALTLCGDTTSSAEEREQCESNIKQNWSYMLADIVGRPPAAELCAKYYGCPADVTDQMVLSADGNKLLNDAAETVRFAAKANTDYCAYGLDQCVTMCDAKRPDQYAYFCGNNPTSGDILPSSCTCVYK